MQMAHYDNIVLRKIKEGDFFIDSDNGTIYESAVFDDHLVDMVDGLDEIDLDFDVSNLTIDECDWGDNTETK